MTHCMFTHLDLFASPSFFLVILINLLDWCHSSLCCWRIFSLMPAPNVEVSNLILCISLMIQFWKHKAATRLKNSLTFSPVWADTNHNSACKMLAILLACSLMNDKLASVRGKSDLVPTRNKSGESGSLCLMAPFCWYASSSANWSKVFDEQRTSSFQRSTFASVLRLDMSNTSKAAWQPR